MRFDNLDSNRLNSYQFKISQQIFGKRISLNLSRKEAAKLVGLNTSDYTKIEQGIDLKSSKEKYKKVFFDVSNLEENYNVKVKETDTKILDSSQSFTTVAQFKVPEFGGI